MVIFGTEAKPLLVKNWRLKPLLKKITYASAYSNI